MIATKPGMTMNSFYQINCQYKRGCIHIESDTEYDFRKFFSFQDNDISNSKFKIARGGKFLDLIPFNTSLHFAVSDKMRNIIVENHINGIDFFPIRIDNSVDIWGIMPTSAAGKIENLERLNNLEDETIEFNTSSWDGSDIFYLQDTLCLICTPKVKDILEYNKITNISFTPCIGMSY